jgi:hypothetical protein
LHLARVLRELDMGLLGATPSKRRWSGATRRSDRWYEHVETGRHARREAAGVGLVLDEVVVDWTGHPGGGRSTITFARYELSSSGPADRSARRASMWAAATWHSGTLAAAKQAVLLGVRGIALSAPINDETSDLSLLEPWIDRELETLLMQQEPGLVNVNFPAQPRGLQWTAQAVDHYDGKVVPGEDPMGRRHFWFTVVPIEQLREGTDLWAVNHGYVSLTPLRLDLTDHEALQRVMETIPLS